MINKLIKNLMHIYIKKKNELCIRYFIIRTATY